MRDVEAVTAEVEDTLPGVQWNQVSVSHPGADDDGLWFFWLADKNGEVQIESWGGTCPFLVETDKHDDRFVGQNISEVATKVVEWLEG